MVAGHIQKIGTSSPRPRMAANAARASAIRSVSQQSDTNTAVHQRCGIASARARTPWITSSTRPWCLRMVPSWAANAVPASGWPPAVPISKAASACASASAAPRVMASVARPIAANQV